MADLVVDLDGLERLVGALERIDGQLERARADLRSGVDVLGDDDVVEGLERFEQRWRDGREAIRENGATLRTMVSESVRTYRQTDSDLAAGLTTSTTRTGGGS